MMSNKSITRELAEKAIKKIQQAADYYDEIERLAEAHKEQLKETHYDAMSAEPCKYCCDTGIGYDELATVGIYLGDIGEINAGINFLLNRDSPSQLSVYVEYIWDGRSEVLKEETLDVLYCPFCGRRLEK